MELFHQIRSDALRTFLSLVGVSVGIFTVTVSFALVDAFSRSVVAGFDHFGSDMIMVERFPVVEEIPGQASNDGENDWSRYAARPQPTVEDFRALASIIRPQAIEESGQGSGIKKGAVTPGLTGGPAAWTAFAGSSEADIACDGKSLRNCKLVGVSGAWQHLVYSSVCAGRDFSLAELSSGDAKVIIGAKVAQDLFGIDVRGGGSGSAARLCGRTVRIDGRNMTVIGVLAYEGKNIINLYATDYAVFVPFLAAEQIAGKGALETMIAIGPGVAGQAVALEETRRALRAQRRLLAVQEDNFALNTMADLSRETVSLTRKISAVGIVVALFSLLIGGFGIVNIMLVSVKERTFQIGLKKALGASRRRILLEFMAEALAMSVLGATFGLLLAWGALSLIPAGVISARLTAAHIALAFGIAIVLGLFSGILPAAQASRLNPVDALRK